MILRGQVWLAVALALAGSSLIGAGTAGAVSITNRDDKEHKLTLVEDEGATKSDHMLKPSQVLEGVCKKGCILRLNDSEDEYVLESADVVSIEEGDLYYDTEPPGEAPAPGTPAPGTPAAPAPAAPATPPPVKK